MDFEIPSWDNIEKYLIELAKKIAPLRNKIEIIVCIWRGGAFPSRLLSDFLNIHTVCNICVDYYDDIQKRKEFPVITQTISTDIEGKNVLVCDDVSDSGNSLIQVQNYLKQRNCASIRTATIYIKPWTKFRPDFYVKETTLWIIFPWERIETLEKLNRKYLKQGKSLEELRGELLSAGFPQRILDFYYSTKMNRKTPRNLFNGKEN